MNEISPQELKKRLDGNDRPLLLDVRQDWETKLCRLPTPCTSRSRRSS